MSEEKVKIAWVCDLCNWLTVSDSREHHQMDYCQCKKSAVDLETYMCRFLGVPRTIARFKEGDKWRYSR